MTALLSGAVGKESFLKNKKTSLPTVSTLGKGFSKK
jgi:hypothetical protein